MTFKIDNLIKVIFNPATLILFFIEIISLLCIASYATDNINNTSKKYINITIVLFLWIVVVAIHLVQVCYRKYLELSSKEKLDNTKEKQYPYQKNLERTMKNIDGFDENNSMVKLCEAYVKIMAEYSFMLFIY